MKEEARELALNSGGVTIRGKVLFPAGADGAPLVVLCHGIPSGKPAEGDPGYEALARRFLAGGAACCIFNFRGTGSSDGNFSLLGWAQDISAVLDASLSAAGPFRGCDPERVSLVGFSGGGAVGIVCAARRPGLRALASLSSPADFSRLITRENIGAFVAHARCIGIIRDPDYPASEEEYYREIYSCRPVEEVAGVAPTPLLIVHGDRDDTVPAREAFLLYGAAKDPKELFIVPGGGHKLRLDERAMEKTVGWILERA